MSNKPQNDRFKVDHKHLARELKSVGIESGAEKSVISALSKECVRMFKDSEATEIVKSNLDREIDDAIFKKIRNKFK